MEPVTLTPAMLALVPVVAAILQLAKRFEPLQKLKSYLPFISIGIALGLGSLANMPNLIISSVIIGLVASGGYDLLKAPKPNS